MYWNHRGVEIKMRLHRVFDQHDWSQSSLLSVWLSTALDTSFLLFLFLQHAVIYCGALEKSTKMRLNTIIKKWIHAMYVPSVCHLQKTWNKSEAVGQLAVGSFTNYDDKIVAFFDHLSTCIDIFYGMNADKKWTFLDHLPTSSCKRILWTTPNI